MVVQRNRIKVVPAAILAAVLATLVLAGSASAKLVGEFTKFEQCPWTNPEVAKCLYSLTEGGEVVLGKKKVPIVNPAVLQGGFAAPVERISKFFGAKNGETLSKAPQPVPGGLLGLVPPESSPPLVAALVELAAENGLTGVNSTLELAGPATDIRVSELNLGGKVGVALKMPVKVHLENPFLGSNCYVGSNSSPIIWELTTGKTSPPPPNESITGSAGKSQFLEGGRILRLNGSVLVDNAWAAPGATGCGGLLSLLVDPVVNASSGLPAPAGTNTAILKATTSIATATAVKTVDEANP